MYTTGKVVAQQYSICTPLEDEVPNNLQLSGFADDHSLTTFKASDRNAEQKQQCMLNIKHATHLKMNPAKTVTSTLATLPNQEMH